MKEKTDCYITETYKRFPVEFVRGKGVYLYDNMGKKYLDCLSGIAVNALGYSNEKLLDIMKHWNGKPLHLSNLFYSKEQGNLAEAIIEESFKGKVFFSNSGTEANEAAFKLARKYSFKRYGKTERYEIITMENSFHGRTFASMAATGQRKIKGDYAPHLQGFKHIKFNDYKALFDSVSDKTCAVMIEVIQGEGGVIEADREYLKKLKELCVERDILFMVDEIQTGLGRTGKMFAYQHYDVEPDIFTLAKALGGGLPLGCMVAKESIAGFFSPGDHASTFGGNLLACALGFEVINQLRGGIIDNCKSSGAYFKERLLALKDKYDEIVDVRGRGLILGIEFKDEVSHLVEKCLNEGLIINCTAGKVIRFLPPLIITQDEIDEALIIFENVLRTKD
ncbi:MAG: aspartate aminotransferase family protein [Candidatus Schekmanbacteria bacterium]|nr:MAG: aspartate aminotransferase family protein [Candidatus Schekmanbacteria bacterium]